MLQNRNGRTVRIDPFTTVIPFFAILLCCAAFIAIPDGSAAWLNAVRDFLGETCGVYYLVTGLLVFLLSIYFACSRFGNIRLGKADEKPRYSFFSWGAMMFTAGLAADILFYSLSEWISYAEGSYLSQLGTKQDFASTMPLFHWGPIPWAFYAVLAACFGFMLHVRGRKRRKYSEACRSVLGRWTDRAPGRLIDVLAVFALLAGTATTFSVATPLLSGALLKLLDLPTESGTRLLSIGILLFVCAVYTISVMRGMRGVQWLAKSCMYLFFALLAFVLFFGGQTRYILETGFSAVGNLAQNFVLLSTRTDPLRATHFPQDWTIFYWAYWMVWCVAAPFFMGSISRGRTVREVILGAYAFGLSATFLSFIILGNYSLGLEMHGILDVSGMYASLGSTYETILAVLGELPVPKLVLALLICSMIAFYATSFDSITLVAAAYSYRPEENRGEEGSKEEKEKIEAGKGEGKAGKTGAKKIEAAELLEKQEVQAQRELEKGIGEAKNSSEKLEKAGKLGKAEKSKNTEEIEDGEETYASPLMKLFWSILLILLPVALLFSESSMQNLQTVSIIAACPIALVILLIIASFWKDGSAYLREEEAAQK